LLGIVDVRGKFPIVDVVLELGHRIEFLLAQGRDDSFLRILAMAQDRILASRREGHDT
jgi:hypothetical protein